MRVRGESGACELLFSPRQIPVFLRALISAAERWTQFNAPRCSKP